MSWLRIYGRLPWKSSSTLLVEFPLQRIINKSLYPFGFSCGSCEAEWLPSLSRDSSIKHGFGILPLPQVPLYIHCMLRDSPFSCSHCLSGLASWVFDLLSELTIQSKALSRTHLANRVPSCHTIHGFPTSHCTHMKTSSICLTLHKLTSSSIKNHFVITMIY